MKQILRLKEVIALTGIGRSSIYYMTTSGSFPARVKLGTRMVGWYADEIDRFLAERQRIDPLISVYPTVESDLSGRERAPQKSPFSNAGFFKGVNGDAE